MLALVLEPEPGIQRLKNRSQPPAAQEIAQVTVTMMGQQMLDWQGSHNNLVQVEELALVRGMQKLKALHRLGK